MQTLHLGFFASHGGSNMQKIIDACKDGSLQAVPEIIISNNSGATAKERAGNEGIPFYHISDLTHPDPIDQIDYTIYILHKHNVDTIVLAGYMKMLDPQIIREFKGRVLNIHPALLPKYGGKGMYGKFVHEKVIENKETESGATIHLVDEQYDNGRILAQNKVPVFQDDSPETLAARVLSKEHILYVDTLKKIVSGEIKI